MTKRIIEVALCAALAIGMGTAALAQGGADAIGARRGFMKSVGVNLGAARGADAAAAKAGAEKLLAGFKAFPGQFPAGSDSAAGATRAKAEIWSDNAGFVAANQKAVDAAQKLLDAVNSGNAEAIATAAGPAGVQGTCGGCHTPYRGPPV